MENTFTLPNEVVTVKFIPRKVGMAANVDSNHVIAGGMFKTAVKKYTAPLQRNGSIANILTAAEKNTLEKLTGLNLSIYDKFWETFKVSLRKDSESNILHLSNPMDYIQYKILVAYSKNEIAPNWESRFKKSTYLFAITREDEIITENASKFTAKKDAFKAYGKIEDDKDQIIGLLRLLTNKPISPDSKLPWLKGQLEQIIDTSPLLFLNAIKDKSLDTKLLIENAINKKVITKKGTRYSTVDGLELCAADETPTLQNVVKFLDDPINSEIRTIIEAKTNRK